MSKITDLSKSRYCKGVQCPKILWLEHYKPEEKADILPESVLENGNRVGDLARRYFGDYSLVEFSFDKKVKHDDAPDVLAMLIQLQQLLRGGHSAQGRRWLGHC